MRKVPLPPGKKAKAQREDMQRMGMGMPAPMLSLLLRNAYQLSWLTHPHR